MTVGRRSMVTTTYILLSRLIVLAANVLVVLLVTRYLGREGFGHYAFVMAYSLIVGTLATGGTFAILIRDTARDRTQAGENLGSALQVQLTYTVVATALGALLLPLFTNDPLVRNATLLSILAVDIQVLANLYMWVFTAFEDTFYMTLSVILERGLFVAGVLLVIYFNWGFIALFGVQLCSFVVKLVFCATIVYLRFARPVWRFDGERFRYFWRESLPLLFSNGFRTLDSQLDAMLIQLLGTAAQLGLYGAPYRILSSVNIVPDSIMAGLLPAFSRLVRERSDKALILYGKIFKYFLAGSAPVAVIVSFLSRPLMTLLFGPEFSEGATTLRFMVWAVVFMFPNYLFQYVLTALGRQEYEMIRLAISLLPHAGLGLLLIPRLGAAGAALGMLVAQIISFAVGFFYVTRILGIYRPWGVALKLAIGALPAVALFYFWPSGPLLAQLVIAGVTYFALLILLRVFRKDELLVLVQAFRQGGKSPVSIEG